MPKCTVSVVNAADIPAGNGGKHAGEFTCGQLSAMPELPESCTNPKV